MERPNRRCWTCEYHDITDNREPCKSCGFDFNNYKEDSAPKTLYVDNELYPLWQPEDLPPSVKGNPDDLPKFEQWQPKEGDWIVLHRQVLLVQKRDDKTTILQDWDKSYQEVFTNTSLSELIEGLFRPAVLSDFACEIPDYGKVWVIEYDNYYIIKPQAGRQFMHYKDEDTISIETLLIKSFIQDRNITVMDEATFKKLNEADNASS